jgi:hypothetical protein
MNPPRDYKGPPRVALRYAQGAGGGGEPPGEEEAMTTRILVVGLAALAILGCEDKRKQAIEKIDHDQEVLRKVGAAVNEVIRNSADCDVAKPLLGEAYQRIDDARDELNATASRATLDALKAQVDKVAGVCP